MRVRSFGVTPAGEEVELHALESSGLRVEIVTYGAALVGIAAPDRAGRRDNVILALPSLADYVRHGSYFGALVGRYANRIAGSSFALDGRRYRLAANEGSNCLHGGRAGFDKAVWRVVDRADGPEPHLTLAHASPDGDQGFPGTVEATVTYAAAGPVLRIMYTATTTRPTVLNLTNHAYFNLGGAACADVLGHELTIAADAFTPVDAQLLPTGEIWAVAATPFDFREARSLGCRIDVPDPQIAACGGYDHNFVLRRSEGRDLQLAALLREPRSGRVLEVRTTEPGLQVYSGNFLDGALRGPDGRAFGRHAGLCLETQHFPDSPNRPAFPSTQLRPGERFESATELRFATDRS
jgi:aldose 1-epimerase